MTKKDPRELYAARLGMQATNYASINEMQHVAFLKILAYFAPCSADDSENQLMTSEALKKMAGSLVSLKVNDISAIMLAVGFDISVNSEMVAAWNIRPLKNPVFFEVEGIA